MQNGKSELASVGAGWNDVNAPHDNPVVDRGILQSKVDASTGRIPQLSKSHIGDHEIGEGPKNLKEI